ncbi:MAG: DUF3253 domain-containing protein [Rhodovulum sp.]
MPPSEADLAAVLMDLAHRRGRGKTFCPSEAARALSADWRPLMPAIRAAAARLQAQGRLQATQRGAPVDPATEPGPIRLGLPRTALAR